MALARAGRADSAGELRRTAEVVAEVLLPRWIAHRAVRSWLAPILIAVATVAAAAPLASMAAVELAVAAWGAEDVTALLAAAALVVPAARLTLGSPPQPALTIARCAPLLRSLDLGGAVLARHWAIAAAVPAMAPTAALSAAAAVVLAAHGRAEAALCVVGAAAAGAVIAVALARRGGRRLAAGLPSDSPVAVAARRLTAVGALAGVLVALPPHAIAAGPTAAGAAGLAAAVWVVGEALLVDARAWLRLQRALIDCGASAVRTAARVAGAAAVACATVGAAVGIAAAATAGADAGLRIGGAAAAAAVAALTAVALEPAAAAPRCVVFAIALAPAVAGAVAGAAAVWIGAGAALVAAVGVVALGRGLR